MLNVSKHTQPKLRYLIWYISANSHSNFLKNRSFGKKLSPFDRLKKKLNSILDQLPSFKRKHLVLLQRIQPLSKAFPKFLATNPGTQNKLWGPVTIYYKITKIVRSL